MGDLIDDDVIESFLSGGGGGELHTVQDVFRLAVTEFSKADLVFGQGTVDALDEAHLLMLLELKLPLCNTAELLSKWGSARLTSVEVASLRKLIRRRVVDKVPVAYLCKGCYFQGEQLYVDSRALIPRSHIGELLNPASKHCLFPPPRGGKQQQRLTRPRLSRVRSVLDLCTGSGALDISAHRLFHQAQQAEGEEKEGEEGEGERLVVHASDVSGDALAVASINLESKGLSHSITLFQGDLFDALPPAPSSSS
jgi:ribosomal protein L3 glutamine methyltransferase